MTDTDVSVRGLTKMFGKIRAVDDVSFDIPAGSVTGFLGPNGAGKTTTLRMIVGLVRATSGTALIGGQPYDQLPVPRLSVGCVLESTGFHPGRRGRDHLRIAARATGLSLRRVDDVIAQVDLGDVIDRRVGTYSLGQRQRLGLATALLGEPPLLILDEPGNGLDPAGMSWLRGLLRDRAAAGHSVIVSSHVLSEIAQTADHLVILADGRLRYAGPMSELSDNGSTLEQSFLRLTNAGGPR